MLQVMARLWQRVIQRSHQDSCSQTHAAVMASLVHVLPTEVGRGTPIAGSQLARRVLQQNKQHVICIPAHTSIPCGHIGLQTKHEGTQALSGKAA